MQFYGSALSFLAPLMARPSDNTSLCLVQVWIFVAFQSLLLIHSHSYKVKMCCKCLSEVSGQHVWDYVYIVDYIYIVF